MTVTLTDNNNQYPLANASQGAGACVSFALTPAEIFTTNPIAKSTAYFAVAVGAETGDFEMDGITFTIDNSTDHTSTTFKVDATDEKKTARNLRNMLLSNKKILDNWDIVLNAQGDQVECTTRVWNYKPKTPTTENFASGNITLTTTEYNDAKVKEGLKIVWQLFEGNGSAVMDVNGIVPLIDAKTGDIRKINLSFNDVVTRSLKTTFPFWKYKEVQYDYTILNRYFLRYGWLEVKGCDDNDMLLDQSSDVLIVNSRISKNALMGFIPYCYDINYPTRRAKFLNVSAQRLILSAKDGNHWLWYYDCITAQIDPATIRQFVLYTFLNAAGQVISSTEIDYNDVGVLPLTPDEIGVIMIPCGFGNCPVAIPYNTSTIRVSVRYEDAGGKVQVTESANIQRFEKCGNYEFYFLCSLGGYDTIYFEKIEEVNFSVNQANIQTNKQCRAYAGLTGNGKEPSEANIKDYLTFLNSSGQKQINTSEVKEYRVTSRRVRPDSDDANFFEEFLKSESRKFRIPRGGYSQDTDYLYAENIILVHSNIVTDRDEGMVQYQFVFQFANQNGAVSEY